MAQVTDIWGTATVTPSAPVAPAASEQVASPGPGVFAECIIGATATTVTVVRPGNFPAGDAVTDYSTGAVTSGTRIIPIGRDFRDPTTGNAAVNFSQVTGVTWRIIRFAV